MIFKLFKDSSFLGETEGSEFYSKKSVIALGSIIEFNKKRYCVNNVMIRDNGEIVLEVN
ncbi:hypothetical protein [Priestia megaterium]|uniref:hypothetical protein n=1 Tax=Priestia megaterium TaxID=1404 RepID=UPI0015E388F8|nr:hypothetical protein [Priestia megaterium]